MTRDMKADLIARLNNLRNMSDEEREYSLSDIIDSLSSSRVTVRCKVAGKSSPVPAYNPSVDGDYSEFLALNNVD